MKKTYSINLAGRVFHIDDDAYKLFEDYLGRAGKELEHEPQAIKAWEQKLANCASDKLSSMQQVIDRELAVQIFKELGLPQGAYIEAEEINRSGAQSSNSRYYAEFNSGGANTHSEKRFYRDTDHGMICGVCSGLAAYTGWNLTAIRVILLIVTFTANAAFWLIILAYLMAWLVVPPAVTASQKLEMYGKPATDENIGEQLASDASIYHKSDGKFSSCLGCLLKGFLLALILGFILSLIFATFSMGWDMLSGENDLISNTLQVHTTRPLLIKLSIVAVLILIVLPFLILDKASWLSRQLRLNSSARWLLLMLWIASLIVVIVLLIWLGSKFSIEFYNWFRDIVSNLRHAFTF